MVEMADAITGIAFSVGAALFVSYFFLINKFKYFLMVGLWAAFWIFIVFGFMDILYEDGLHYGPINLGFDIMLFTGMGLLGAGWLTYKRPIGHKLTMVGWQLFGLYWLFSIPLHFHHGDFINLMFLGGGLAFFTILGYHEYLSLQWNEQHRGLKFIAGATFITGFIYFYLAKDWAMIYAITGSFEAIQDYSLGYHLIRMVAQHSADFANLLFGYNTFLTGGEILPLEGIGIPIENTGGETIGGISLILACTGIEAMAMFFGAIISVEYEKDPWKEFKTVRPRMKWYRKLGIKKRAVLAFMFTVPVIYLLNLVRNSSIIYFIREGTFIDMANSLNMDEFVLLHGVFFKIFAFAVLIILALVIFDVIPELHTTIMRLFELPKRDVPEEQMVVRRRKEAARRKKEREKEEARKRNDDDEGVSDEE